MFYSFTKVLIRLALKLFCSKITVNDSSYFSYSGPMILACNHPNSFLDAIIIGSQFKQPVHFLARGDAFRKPLVSMILRLLKLIPIYRLSEGREYLALNDATFEKCQQVLLNKGIVLIFSEGLCENSWKLRPLKKGTSRIFFTALQNPVIANELTVLPIGINYNSFQHFGKKIIIHIDKPININDLLPITKEAENASRFNLLLVKKLSDCVLESLQIPEAAGFLLSNLFDNYTTKPSLLQRLKEKLPDVENISALRNINASFQISKNIFLSIFFIVLLSPFTVMSMIFHYPLYLPLYNFIKIKTKGTVFFDSVLFGSLLLIYPLYWIIVNMLSIIFIKSLLLKAAIFFMPFLAWFHLKFKEQLHGVWNYLKLSQVERNQVKEVLH